MQNKGIFIVIEGTNGSGKSTQFELLQRRLLSGGYDVATIKFPQYEDPSSHFIREYLRGAYGSGEQVGPYTGSLFYALDRYAAAARIRQALADGKVVLCDRFVGSNMAHQGTKFVNAEERRGYFIWLDNLEFQILNIPRPDISFVLKVPPEVSQSLMEKSGKTLDLHENLEHQQRAATVYDDMTRLFPRDFTRVDCMEGDQLLPVDMIHARLWEKVSPLLKQPVRPAGQPGILTRLDTPPSPAEVAAAAPAMPPQLAIKAEEAKAHDDAVQTADEPLVSKDEAGRFRITEAGNRYLDEAVTSTAGQVYAFREKLSPMTVAAAMARLSRRGDDMRVTILDEFANKADKDAQLLGRVITAYGDDSVQQLAGIHVVVEGATKLITKHLERGRLAAYLEQSTRYIYFDQKDANGRYRYYTPASFDADTKLKYEQTMNYIFGRYSEMVHILTDYVRANSTVPAAERDVAFNGATRAQACDAIRAVLPASTTTTVGIFASGQALESLIMRLRGENLPEARDIGQQLLDEARKVMPVFFERADKPDRGGATTAYRATTRSDVQRLADEYLPGNHADIVEPVQLTDVWPRNELSLVADMLYDHSDLPLEELRGIVDSWPYDRKAEVLEAYMGERLNRRHRPGRALEKAHYSFDIISDFGTFCDLQRHRMVDDLEWQPMTPRYGYEVPSLVEEAGLADAFEDCFDASLQLYSLLQARGYGAEAQYATLLGHRMRWKVTYNARTAFHLHELRTSPQGHPIYRQLVRLMHDKVASVHPLLASHMKFVNEGESPELTRLAAERYTQFKLAQLDKSQPPIVK